MEFKSKIIIHKLFFHICVISFCVNSFAQENSKTTISVYGLKSIGISQDLAESLQEHLESNLLKFDHYEILSRNDIDLILKENRFQQTGICTEEECLIEAGHILGVEKIITGTISMVGTTYNVVLKLIDVNTAKLESSVNHKHSGSIDTLLDVIEISLYTLLGRDNVTAADSVKQYKIDSLTQHYIENLKEEIVALKSTTTELQRNMEVEKNMIDNLQKKQKLLEEKELDLQVEKDNEDSTQDEMRDKELTAFIFSEKNNTEDIQSENDRIIVSQNTEAIRKKSRRIGIGAIALLSAISLSVFLGQVIGSK